MAPASSRQHLTSQQVYVNRCLPVGACHSALASRRVTVGSGQSSSTSRRMFTVETRGEANG